MTTNRRFGTRRAFTVGLATILLTAAATAPLQGAAQTELGLAEILDRHFQTQGGIERMQSIETLVLTGTLNVAGMEAPFRRLAKRPDRTRIDFTIQGMTGTQAYDGSTAWMFLPFTGQAAPEPMPADLAVSMVEDGDFDGPLANYEAKGNQVELVGIEDVEGTPCYKLAVTLPSGNVRYHHLDAEYFVTVMVSGTQTINGQEVDYANIFGDYREVDGALMPYSLEIRSGGQVQMMTVESVEMNVDIDDAEFSMPQSES